MNIYLQCYLWDQQHQEFQRVQEDHGVQGSQEHQQYQQHPVECSRELDQCTCQSKEIKIQIAKTNEETNKQKTNQSTYHTHRGTLRTGSTISTIVALEWRKLKWWNESGIYLRLQRFNESFSTIKILIKMIHSQQVQQHQQGQGYQAHHEHPGVPQVHEFPEHQPLPKKYI